ncbi:MAG: 30S ribosomal protein S13 [Patescibacteria group bacterium]|jgi:small subunit ribosomal protein S13
MALRIAGVTLPNDKRIEVALTYIFGIGNKKSINILATAKINYNTRVKDVSEEDANRIREIVEKDNKVEGELRRDIMSNIKRLKEISSYRGIRHIKGLPSRGQHTKTNTRTVRGNVRKTMGSGRKPAGQKT